MTRKEADYFVESLKNLRNSATDKQASEAVGLFPTLKVDGSLIAAGTRINWNGTIKKAAVDLWDTAENNPDNTPALWENIDYRNGYRIIPETITVGTAFAKGEYGWWGDVLCVSLIDNNVWTPEQNASGWSAYTGDI